MAFKQDKQDQMQPLVLRNSVDRVQNLLALSKLKVALKSINRIFYTLSKVASKLNNENGFTMPFLKYKRLNLKLRVFLAGQTVSMVTYCVTKMMLGSFRQFFYFKIVASSEKE